MVQTKIKRPSGLGNLSSLLTVICALVAEIIFFAFINKNFLTMRNFLNIGLYAAIVGCVSCSVTFINISGMDNAEFFQGVPGAGGFRTLPDAGRRLLRRPGRRPGHARPRHKPVRRAVHQ